MKAQQFTRDQLIAKLQSLLKDSPNAGQKQFEEATGIKAKVWQRPHLFDNFGDFREAAGFSRNPFGNAKISEDELLQKLATLVKKLQCFPDRHDLARARLQDRSFPAAQTFSRFANKAELKSRLWKWAIDRGDAELATLCEASDSDANKKGRSAGPTKTKESIYLLKGKLGYRIGRSEAPARRFNQHWNNIGDPSLKPIRVYETRYPAAEEAYWIRRFDEDGKKIQGGFYKLTPEDVNLFKAHTPKD